MFDILEQVARESNSGSGSGMAPQSQNIFVVSIGGSLIFNDSGPDAARIRAISDVISSLHSSGKKVVVVVGGGKTARDYAGVMRVFSGNNFDLDSLGIIITRANAFLFVSAIPDAHKEVLTDAGQAGPILGAGRIPVFGGLMPFFTTDSVAALIAEHLNATFVNLTNVDGIYDKDPAEFGDARRFDEIGYNQLVSLILKSGSAPSQNVVLDLAACLILQRSRIPGVVLNGNDPSNLSNFVNGYSFIGTVIKDTGPEENFGETADGSLSGPEGIHDYSKKKKRKRRAKKDDYERPDPYEIDY